jgi:DNA-binding MarR family transcriptional regulator
MRCVGRVYEEELRSAGFTHATQYNVLRVLEAFRPMRQRDLGTAMDLDNTTLTRTLQPLKENDWIEIAPGTDRRERLVSLTSAGRQQLAAALPAWERAQSRIRKVLPAHVWKSMMEMLPVVIRAVADA